MCLKFSSTENQKAASRFRPWNKRQLESMRGQIMGGKEFNIVSGKKRLCRNFNSLGYICTVHFSSVRWPIGSSGGHKGWFSRDPLLDFSAGGPCKQLWHWQGCPLFGVVHPAFFCWPQHHPSSEVPWRMVLERLSWHMACRNHASFQRLTAARRGTPSFSMFTTPKLRTS